MTVKASNSIQSCRHSPWGLAGKGGVGETGRFLLSRSWCEPCHTPCIGFKEILFLSLSIRTLFDSSRLFPQPAISSYPPLKSPSSALDSGGRVISALWESEDLAAASPLRSCWLPPLRHDLRLPCTLSDLCPHGAHGKHAGKQTVGVRTVLRTVASVLCSAPKARPAHLPSENGQILSVPWWGPDHRPPGP